MKQGHANYWDATMTATLFSHPFSSYCQKVLIALWENDVPFTYRHLEEPGAFEELTALWPVSRFPILLDAGRTVVESSIIIEYLGQQYGGPVEMVPQDGATALEVRLMDRFFDNYIMSALQGPVLGALGDPTRLEEELKKCKDALEVAYGWLNAKLSDRIWAAGDLFTMADCAAAPSLFYADWVHEIGTDHRNLRNYRSRLLERPSFARAVEEGRPYRSHFPLGVPDRD